MQVKGKHSLEISSLTEYDLDDFVTPFMKDLRSDGAEWESRRERPGTSSSRSCTPISLFRGRKRGLGTPLLACLTSSTQ